MCRGEITDLWFDDDPAIENAAIAHCNVCPVQTECARTAAAYREEHGIWGGYRMYVHEERDYVLSNYEPLDLITSHDPETRA